jgi:CBS domain containing-hemolysin-like protein
MVEFSETRAGEIMTPRTEICALSIDSTVRQARDLMIGENIRAFRFTAKRLITSKA